jgi:hypothetical protein
VDFSVEFTYESASGRVNSSGRVGENVTRATPRLRIAVGFSRTPPDAQQALAWLMARNGRVRSELRSRRQGKLGDAAFASPGRTAAYLVRGNVLVHIIGVGPMASSMEAVARRVDRAIRGLSANGSSPTA